MATPLEELQKRDKRRRESSQKETGRSATVNFQERYDYLRANKDALVSATNRNDYNKTLSYYSIKASPFSSGLSKGNIERLDYMYNNSVDLIDKTNSKDYYNTFGKYADLLNEEIGLKTYLEPLQQYNIPQKYTQGAADYLDLLQNSVDYTRQLGEGDYNVRLLLAREQFALDTETLDQISKVIDKSFLPDQEFFDNPYLAELYQYDPTDQNDIFRQELGLLPGSFDYANTVEDRQRLAAGELPIEAQTYIDNSEQFAKDYIERANLVQAQVDAEAEWDTLSFWDKIGKKNPYLDKNNPFENDAYVMPKSLQDYREYLAKVEETRTEGTDFFDADGQPTDKPPVFFIPDNLPWESFDFIAGQPTTNNYGLYYREPSFSAFNVQGTAGVQGAAQVQGLRETKTEVDVLKELAEQGINQYYDEQIAAITPVEVYQAPEIVDDNYDSIVAAARQNIRQLMKDAPLEYKGLLKDVFTHVLDRNQSLPGYSVMAGKSEEQTNDILYHISQGDYETAEKLTRGTPDALARAGGSLEDLYEQQRAQDIKDAPLKIADAITAQTLEQEATSAEDFEEFTVDRSEVSTSVPQRGFPIGMTPEIQEENLATLGYTGGIRSYNGMTDEQEKVYSYYLSTDKTKAKEYFDSIERERNASTAALAQMEVEARGETGLGKVSLGVSSIPANLLSVAALIGAGVDSLGEYRPADPNAPYLATAQFVSAAREKTTEDFSATGKFAANTGYSIVDFLTIYGLTGGAGGIARAGGRALTVSILASEAAGQATNQALQRGVTTRQAFVTGLITGGIEAATELITLRALSSLNSAVSAARKGATQSALKTMSTNIVRQMWAEGGEEVIAEILGNLADISINGANSAYEQNRLGLIESGMSPEEAERQTMLKFFGSDVALAWLGGAISGGVIGGGATITQNVSFNNQIDSFIQETQGIDVSELSKSERKTKRDEFKVLYAEMVDLTISEQAKTTAPAQKTELDTVQDEILQDDAMSPSYLSSMIVSGLENQIGATETTQEARKAISYIESTLENDLPSYDTESDLNVLMRNGAQTARVETIDNIGKIATEQNAEFQNDIKEIVRKVISAYGGAEATLSDMDIRTVKAMLSNMMLASIGLPSSIVGDGTAASIENSFNNMVDAFYSEDTKAFNKAKSTLNVNLTAAAEATADAQSTGALQATIDKGNASAVDSALLGAARASAKTYQQLLTARAAGTFVPQARLLEAQAQMNSDINAVTEAATGTPAEFDTFQEQAKSNAVIARALGANGFAATLIQGSEQALNAQQINVIEEIERQTQRNSHVAINFSEDTTIEGLTKKVEVSQEKLTRLEAQQQDFIASMDAQVTIAYETSEEVGKAKFEDLGKERNKLTDNVQKAQLEHLSNVKDLDAFKTQQSIKRGFDQAAQIETGENIEGQQVPPTTDATALPIAEKPRAPGRIDKQLLNEQKAANKATIAETEEQRVARVETERTDKIRTRLATLNFVLPIEAKITDEMTTKEKAIQQKRVEGDTERRDALFLKLNERNAEGGLTITDEEINSLFALISADELIRKVDQYSFKGDDYILATSGLKNRVSFENARARGQQFEEYNPQFAANTLKNALDMITHAEKVMAQQKEMRGINSTTLVNNERPRIQRARQKVTGKISKAHAVPKSVYNFFLGVNAKSAEPMAQAFSGNDYQDPMHTILFDMPQEAYNRLSYLQLNDLWYYGNFFGKQNKAIHDYLPEFEKTLYTYTLENGQTVGLTMSDIKEVSLYRRAGNEMYDGIIFSNKNETDTMTDNDINGITSILVDAPINEQAQRIADKAGQRKLAMAREISEFAWNLFNDNYYQGIDGFVPTMKTRRNKAGQESKGIDRTVGRGHYPRQTFGVAQGSKEGTKPTALISHIKKEGGGKVRFEPTTQLLERELFNSAHADAYDGYIEFLNGVMNGGLEHYTTPAGEDRISKAPGVKDVIRQTFGEDFVTWVDSFQEAIVSEREFKEQIRKTFDRAFSNVRNVNLASPGVWAKQTMSYFHAMAYIDVEYLAKALTMGKLTELDEYIIRNYAPEIPLRKQGYALRETSESAVSNAKIAQTVVRPLLAVDQLTVLRIFIAAKLQVTAQNPNLEGEALYAEIGLFARNVIEKTQPTFAPHTSSMSSRQKGFIPKLMTMYSTATNSMFNTTVGAIRDIRSGNVKQGMRKLISVAFSLSGAVGINALRDWAFPGGGKDEPESGYEAFIESGWYKAISGVGSMFLGIRTLLNSLEYKNLNVPLIREVEYIIDSIVDTSIYATDDKTKNANDIYGSLKKLVIAVSAIAGIPARQFEKYMVKLMVRLVGGKQGESDYDAFFGRGQQPSSNYPDLRRSLEDEDYNEALQYAKVIINKGGELKNFLNAKTGGGMGRSEGSEPITVDEEHKARTIWQEALDQLEFERKKFQ